MIRFALTSRTAVKPAGAILALLVCLGAGGVKHARAQQSVESLLAKDVVEIRAGQEILGKFQPGQRVEVSLVKGDWVGIKHHDHPGWVPRNQLIEPEKAYEYFSDRLQENPRDHAAAVGRARVLIERGERLLNDSVKEWSESLKQAPNRGDVYIRRARVWLKMKQLDRAIADFEMAIKVTPFNPTAYQELAGVLLERGDYRRAIANYGEVIRLRPWQPEPFSDRGWARHLAGEHDAAMADMEIARRLNPQDPQVWYRLGLLSLAGKGSSRTKDFFDKALELNPLMAEALLARAPLHQTYDKDRLALMDYNSAIHLNPQSLEAYSARGNFHLEQGEYDRALRDLTHVVQLSPRQATAFFDRGKIYLEREQGDLALADLNRAAELNPELHKIESEVFVRAYRERAEQHFAAKRYDLAAADYSSALKVTPDDLKLLSARGQAYLAQKDYSQGIADLSRVAEAETENPQAWFALAHGWYLAGQYSRAAVEYRKAILVEPTFVPAYTNLAWLLATCPQKEFRNGKLAVRYAKYACELTGWKEYAILDTLAAAEAEDGNFHEAIKWQSAVVYLAPASERAAFRQRLELYGGLKPYYEVREESAGITSETDTAGVLAAKGGEKVPNFAKSLGLPLPDLDELSAANPPQESPASEEETQVAAKADSPDTKEESPVPDFSSPESKSPAKTVSETKTLGPDDPQAVAELKKLGGRTSLHLRGQVQSLGLQYTKFEDKHAELLSGVPALEIIDLTFTQIGEPTFKKLGSMKQLKLIVLDQTKVTDELLANLSAMPNLEVLSVKATSITGAGLKHLEKLPKLNMVLINGTRVTGDDIKQLQSKMPKVKFMR